MSHIIHIMSRSRRLAITDEEDLQCPSPLRRRLASIGRGTILASDLFLSPTIAPLVGRGRPLPRSSPSSSAIGIPQIIDRVRLSRTAKSEAIIAIDEANDESEGFSDNESENSISDAEFENGESDDSDSELLLEDENQVDVGEQFQGRDGTIWQKDPLPGGRRQAINVMRAAGGLSSIGRRHCRETALSNWQIFVDNQLLDMIVDCTNEKARSVNANFVTNRNELNTFIGVGILIGVNKG